MHWTFAKLRDLFAPRGCLACDAVVTTWVAFCKTCTTSVVRLSGPVTTAGGLSVLSPFVYGGSVADTILRLKFGGRGDLAEPMAALVAASCNVLAFREQPCALVPVPSSPSRLAERGFNPPSLVAAELSKQWRLPREYLLGRIPGPHQLGLSRKERIDNAKRAFHWKGAKLGAQNAVLLVDDVTTTGATLDACARVLSENGVRVVAAVTVAVADPDR
ncbi:MAG: hypothetical protein U0174_19135 [Polyangiaceae bacterium]